MNPIPNKREGERETTNIYLYSWTCFIHFVFAFTPHGPRHQPQASSSGENSVLRSGLNRVLTTSQASAQGGGQTIFPFSGGATTRWRPVGSARRPNNTKRDDCLCCSKADTQLFSAQSPHGLTDDGVTREGINPRPGRGVDATLPEIFMRCTPNYEADRAEFFA